MTHKLTGYLIALATIFLSAVSYAEFIQPTSITVTPFVAEAPQVFGANRVRLSMTGNFIHNDEPVTGVQDALDMGGRPGPYPSGYALALYARDGKLFGYPLWNVWVGRSLNDRYLFIELGTIGTANEVRFTISGFDTHVARWRERNGSIERSVYLMRR